MRRTLGPVFLAILNISWITLAHAGADQPWQEIEGPDSGGTFGALVLLGLLAGVVYLVSRGELISAIIDTVAAAFIWIRAYLLLVWIITCIGLVYLALSAIGLVNWAALVLSIPCGWKAATAAIDYFGAKPDDHNDV